jgi:fumarylacetoacetase
VIDETHDPALRSWVVSANPPGSDFPIQNLPFGVFQRPGEPRRVGVAIGDQILDLVSAHAEGLFAGDAEAAARECALPRLNGLMALGPRYWSALRGQISTLLRADSTAARMPGLGDRILLPAASAQMQVPAAIGDYTDFYASVYHASNVGAMFRPEQPLLPNYKWVPIGYHGRASSIVTSGTPVARPTGQTKPPTAAAPSFGPSRALDYEAELGFFVGIGNALGQAIPIGDADAHIFGVCLVNDWSARDIQTWEYQPLGPFLAKSFSTTVSPWVVTRDALAPFRVPAPRRPAGDPEPLPYLQESGSTTPAIDLTIDVALRTPQMRNREMPAVRVSRSNVSSLYWTPAQLVTHHTSNGCNLQPGDLLASGTVSGPTHDALACLLELTRRGAEPIELPTGERRGFLEDGDEVVLRGFCERPGAVRIGLGECVGVVTA